MVTFLYTQSGSGNPSPTNVRDIVPALNITGIGKVYGGSFDLSTGTLYTPWILRTPDISGASFSKVTGANSNCNYFTINAGKTVSTTETDIVSNKFRTTSITTTNSTVGLCLSTDDSKIKIRPSGVSSMSSASAMRTYISSISPVDIVYKLATPTVTILTSKQITEVCEQLGIDLPSAFRYRRRAIMSLPHKQEITGKILTFKAVKNVPFISIKAGIKAVQSGTGDPSPTNVRPITARRNSTFFRTGKCLFGGVDWVHEILNNIGLPTWDKTNKNINFQSSAVATPMLGGMFKENTQYTFIMTYGKSSGTGSNLRVVYTDGTYDSITAISSSDVGDDKKATVVFVSDEGKTIDYVIKIQSAGRTYLYYDESGIFEGVLTAADFVPFAGTIIRYPFGYDFDDRIIAQGTYSSGGGATSTSSLRVRTNVRYFLKAGTYNVGNDQGFKWNAYVYDMDLTYLQDESVTDYPGVNTTLTILGDRYVRFSFTHNDDSATVPEDLSGAYVQSTTIPEIYGGYIDVKNGILTVTHDRANLGNCTWSSTTSTTNVKRFYTGSLSSRIEYASDNNETADIICTQYKSVPFLKLRNATYDKCIAVSESGSVVVRDTTYTESDPATTNSQFKTAMDGVYIVFKLAEPVSYQLTPTQVKTLLENNVWTDTGDSNIKVWKN